MKILSIEDIVERVYSLSLYDIAKEYNINTYDIVRRTIDNLTLQSICRIEVCNKRNIITGELYKEVVNVWFNPFYLQLLLNEFRDLRTLEFLEELRKRPVEKQPNKTDDSKNIKSKNKNLNSDYSDLLDRVNHCSRIEYKEWKKAQKELAYADLGEQRTNKAIKNVDSRKFEDYIKQKSKASLVRS